MLCPDCNHKLNPIQIPTTTTNTTLDYCRNCGGVWTDQGEINFVETSDLKSLASLLPNKPKPRSNQIQYCPRDRTKLAYYQAESVPPDVTILNCPKCTGSWFPNKNIFEFKDAQKIKVDYFKRWKIPLQTVYSVLLPVIALIFFAGSIALTYVAFRNTRQTSIRARDVMTQPIVTHPEVNQAFISFVTYQPATSRVNYWISESKINTQNVTTISTSEHSVLLKNLILDRTYSFQVVLVQEGEEIISEVFTFETR